MALNNLQIIYRPNGDNLHIYSIIFTFPYFIWDPHEIGSQDLPLNYLVSGKEFVVLAFEGE